MRINILRAGLTLLTVAGLASCGGDGGQPLTSTTAAAVLGQLNTVLGQLPRSNTAPTFPAGATPASSVKPMATDCETVSPAVLVDADSDGIAAEKTGTYDCTGTTVGTNTYTRKGTYTVQDMDETVAGMIGGMRATFAITAFTTVDSTNGDVSRSTHNGTWAFTGDGQGALNSTSEFNGHTFYDSGTMPYNYDYDYSYTWNWAIDPDTTGPNAFDSGSQTFDGTFNMDGTFMSEDAAGNHTVVTGTYATRYRSKNLRYDTTCLKYYRSGSVMVDDMNGNAIEIRYACATAKLYVNGVESDWWTP